MRPCPKKILNGPCGGYRGDLCEVGDFECPWVKAYKELKKMGKELQLLKPNFGDFLAKMKPCKSTFSKELSEGTIIVEYYPPFSKGIGKALEEISALSEFANFVQIVDAPMGRPTIDPISLAVVARLRGINVIPEIMCRGRTRGELVRLIATIISAGVRAAFIATGDWPEEGNAFYDLDSTRLTYLAKLISCYGVDYNGREIGVSGDLGIGVAANPNSRYLELEAIRVGRKAEAGADFVITQPAEPSLTGELRDLLRDLGYEIQIVPAFPIGDERRLKALEKLVPGFRAEGILSLGRELLETFYKFQEELVGVANSFYITPMGSYRSAMNFLRKLRGDD